MVERRCRHGGEWAVSKKRARLSTAIPLRSANIDSIHGASRLHDLRQVAKDDGSLAFRPRWVFSHDCCEQLRVDQDAEPAAKMRVG